MDFWDRMKNTFEKGIEGSKDLLSRAKDTAQDLGERGVLRVEILQLENQVEKLVGQLGARVFEVLSRDGAEMVDPGTEGVGELLGKIEDLQERIREKEAAIELATRKESAE